MRPAGVTDSAAMIARDLVGEVGRGPALGYLMGKALGASSLRRAWRTLRLVMAVLFASDR